VQFRFLDFELDPARRELRRRGEPVDLQPLVYELLLYLVTHRDRVVPKDELLDTLWADSAVTEGSLARAVSHARRGLGDIDRDAPMIRTHPRVGYRFMAEVEESADPPPRDRSRDTSRPHRETAVRSGYADAHDTHIAYQVLGNGPVDLVVVHGWILSVASIWEDEIMTAFHRRLAQRARLILFDKRGTGLSDRVKDLPGLAQRMEDLTAVLDAVGSRRAHVLGLSEGAPMSLLYAASHPERVAGLALLGGFARMMRDDDQPFGWTSEDVDRLRTYIRTRWGEGGSLSASFASRLQQPGVAAWLAHAERIGGSPGAAMALWNMNQAIDVRDVLPILQTESLVMHAARDRVIDVAHGRQLAEAIQGARYVEIDAIDHIPLGPPHAEGVLEELFAWLDRPKAEPITRRRLATLLLLACDRTPDRALSESIDQLLVAHGGRRVETGRVEHSAIFDGPVAAARCARALLGATRRQGGEARLAFHCSEFECHEDVGDHASPTAPSLRVLGPAVDLTANLLERAQAGEIVTTGIVTDLSLGSGLEFAVRASEAAQRSDAATTTYTLR
jgi:pimeloyl-ACP methyl ester carboxylesterase